MMPGALRRMISTALLLGAAVGLGGGAVGQPPADLSEEAQAGWYVLRAGACVACHTAEYNGAPFLGGGRAIETPFGTFYGPNITPDPRYGIGQWEKEDLRRALTQGVDPDGRHYYPVFPYTAYTRMTDDDIDALWAYLQTVPATAKPNYRHEVRWPLTHRSLLMGWKALHFRPGAFEPDPERSASWNRGAYLVHALGHCAECHTPRTRLGGLDPERAFAGNPDVPEDPWPPNITPHPEAGIGQWRERHLIRYLGFGVTPDGDFAGGSMADFIETSSRHLTEEDLRAIAEYILSLEPSP